MEGAVEEDRTDDTCESAEPERKAGRDAYETGGSYGTYRTI